MRDLLCRLRSNSHLKVVENSDASVVSIEKSDCLTFEITIPNLVLEWFAVAKDSKGEVWSDWADYYSTNGESPEVLKLEMASDIECFINNLLVAEVRVTEQAGTVKSEPQLTWNRNDVWQEVSLCSD